MPRIQMTTTVRVAILILRIYLLGMLVLIALKFVLWTTQSAKPVPAPAASTAPAATAPATLPAPTSLPAAGPR